jgi:hypothetical protein
VARDALVIPISRRKLIGTRGHSYLRHKKNCAQKFFHSYFYSHLADCVVVFSRKFPFKLFGKPDFLDSG